MDKAKKVILGIGLLAAIALAFAFAASGSGVIEQNAEGNGGVTVAASAVTSSINYQGRLTDNAGEPLSGTYTMTFRLYNVSSGGTALATDTNTVEVTDGLFNTEIDFNQEYFDGRELWLGIKVGGEEMSPRQEFKQVPYALSLVPGAVINGSVSGGPVLKVENTDSAAFSHGVYARTEGDNSGGVYARTEGDGSTGVLASTSGNGSEGVYAYTYGDRSEGVSAYTAGNDSEGVYVYTSGNDSEGVWAYTSGYNSDGVYAYTSGDRSTGVRASTYGNNSDAVHAYSAKGYGVYGKGGKYGGYFTTTQGGTSGNNNAGVNATTTYDYSDGVSAYTSGFISYGVSASTSGDRSHGVHAGTTGDRSHGVSVYTLGDNSQGVRASTYGDDSYGVYAYTWGDNSDAVYASSVKGYGVYGKGKYGGYFTTNQGGTGGNHNAGVNATTTYDYSDGVHAHTTGLSSSGVRVDTSGDASPGVSAYTSGFGSRGVSAHTTGDNSTGVHAYSAKFYGVYGRTDSADSAGVYAIGKDSGADLILGGGGPGGASDDGAIYSDPKYPSSDIFLITNDGLVIYLDKNGDGEDADFGIRDKNNKLIFNVDESGDMYASGTKNAVVATEDYGARKMYALESTEVWFEDFGTAQLQDGVAVVEIDPVFAETVNLSVAYHVFFTPVDGWAPIYVTNKTSTSFELRDAHDEADITLEYRIVAKRLGYEDVRMVQVEFGNEEV